MCEVEIITGLNKSGKTLFLNYYLEITNVEKERILILMFNAGNRELRKDFKNVCIKQKNFHSVFEMNESKFIYLLNLYKPHRIIIEGDYISAKHIFNIMKSNNLKNKLIISSRINIVNLSLLDKFSKCTSDNVNSNIVVINNFDKLNFYHEYIQNIKYKNKNSFVFYVESFDEIYFKLKDHKLIKNNFHKFLFKYLKEYL